jgi:RNA polymerase sigma-70 factor (family 1)
MKTRRADQPADSELAVRISRGNNEAYSLLYHRYFEDMYLYAYSKVGDAEETKDLVHESFIKLWEHRATLAEVVNVKAYLFTITRNIILDLIAHHKVIDKYYESFVEMYPSIQNADFIIREKQIQQLIDEAIDQLPAKMKVIFELSRKEFLSYSEIAEKLNISDKTVKTQINNALKQLKNKLPPFLYFFLL